MENKRNYYRILHVQPDAPDAIIRASYRTLMQRLKAHPDLGGDHWNAALINEAYTVLLNPQQRADYDARMGIVNTWRSQGSDEELTDEEQQRAANDHTPEPPPAVTGRCHFCRSRYDESLEIGADSLCAACASPLAPARSVDNSASWNRAIQRVPKNQTVFFYLDWPNPSKHVASSRDVSLTGMQLEASEPVSEGAMLKIDCDLCQAVGQAVYCRREPAGLRGPWIIGVEFRSLRFLRPRGGFVSTRA